MASSSIISLGTSTGVFASDQHKPSVFYERLEQGGDGPSNPYLGADQPSALSGPEVMELKEDPAIELEPLVDWRVPYLDYLLYDMLPMDKTEDR